MQTEPAMIQVPEEYLKFVQKVLNAYPEYVEVDGTEMKGYLNQLAEFQILIVR